MRCQLAPEGASKSRADHSGKIQLQCIYPSRSVATIQPCRAVYVVNDISQVVSPYRIIAATSSARGRSEIQLHTSNAEHAHRLKVRAEACLPYNIDVCIFLTTRILQIP